MGDNVAEKIVTQEKHIIQCLVNNGLTYYKWPVTSRSNVVV